MKLYLLRRKDTADRWDNYEPMQTKEIEQGNAVLLGFNAFFRLRDAKQLQKKWRDLYDIRMIIVPFKPTV